MTQQKHLKAVIRARMARTGESYTAARAHVVKTELTPSLDARVEFRAHDRHCMTAVFTPDDRHIVTGGFGGQARIWTVAGEPAGELVGHESSVNVVCISADGSLAVTASSDKTVRAWDLPGRTERAVLGRHKRQVLGLALDDTRGIAWSGGHDGRLQAMTVQDAEGALTIDVGSSVTSVAVRREDGVVAAGTVGGGISIRRADGTEITRLARDRNVTTAVTWSTDGSFLLASSPGAATVWATDEWEEVRSLPTGGGGMLPIALSPDGRRVAIGWDNHLALWGPDEDTPSATIDGLPKGVYGLAFSHDGRLLAMTAADGRVRTHAVA
jgi:WD40 repeat protein